MACEHDLAERETACADGMCPMCLAAENERLRSYITEHDAKPFKLSADSERLYRFLNCLDIDDLDERAERLMQSQFDNVMVGPSNRAGIKATISQHFHAIRDEAKRTE